MSPTPPPPPGTNVLALSGSGQLQLSADLASDELDLSGAGRLQVTATPPPPPPPDKPPPPPPKGSGPPPAFTTGDLPGGPWRIYVSRATVAAVRINGPFTMDGEFCPDGWVVEYDNGACLAVDADTFSSVFQPMNGGTTS